MKDLIGKWKQTDNIRFKDTTEYMFVNDSTYIAKDMNGHFQYPVKCHFDFSNNSISFTRTRKGIGRPDDEITISLTFIDNNTLLFKTIKVSSNEHLDPKKAFTTKLVRVDNKDYSDLAKAPTLSNLRGSWMHRYNMFISFLNDTLASVKDGDGSPNLYKYTVDFTKFPHWADFNQLEKGKPFQAVFTLPTDSTMTIETFPWNKRKDHFNTFGSMGYIKLDSARKARVRSIQQRSH